MQNIFFTSGFSAPCHMVHIDHLLTALWTTAAAGWCLAMRGGAATVLALLTVVQLVHSATDRPKGPKTLVCYQCTGDSRQRMAKCDAEFWKVMTPAERKALEEPCPARRSAFCVTKVQRFPGFNLTTRGCAADVDSHGHKLREGCETLSLDPETEEGEEPAHTATVCFCKGALCNAAPPTGALRCAVAAAAAAAATLAAACLG